MPVEEQVAIALYRFGHFGNGVALVQVVNWAGVGYGTVDDCTRRVVTALTSNSFRAATIYPPTTEERLEAADWVYSIVPREEWSLGRTGVDGSLIPLFQRPGHYGSSFFDRKSNYSLNIQVCGLLANSSESNSY